MSREVPLLTDEHRDRFWKDRNGDWWRYHREKGRQGWQYTNGSERWRFGGMHIPHCGPFTEMHRVYADEE